MGSLQSEKGRQFPKGESRADTHVHVVACDPVDEWVHEGTEKMGKYRTIRLIVNDDIKPRAPCAEIAQGLFFKVMEKQIRHKNAAILRRWAGKQIAHPPLHGRRPEWRGRSKIVGSDGGRGENSCHAGGQQSLPGTDFHNSTGGGFWKMADRPADPAFIAHQRIDPLQIPAAPQRLRIVCGQMVQDFR